MPSRAPPGSPPAASSSFAHDHQRSLTFSPQPSTLATSGSYQYQPTNAVVSFGSPLFPSQLLNSNSLSLDVLDHYSYLRRGSPTSKHKISVRALCKN